MCIAKTTEYGRSVAMTCRALLLLLLCPLAHGAYDWADYGYPTTGYVWEPFDGDDGDAARAFYGEALGLEAAGEVEHDLG